MPHAGGTKFVEAAYFGEGGETSDEGLMVPQWGLRVTREAAEAGQCCRPFQETHDCSTLLKRGEQ